MASFVILPKTIVSGQKAVTAAGTAEALGTSTQLISGVTIKALADNTDYIYVGDSDVSSSAGIELSPGESVFVECNNLATIYVDSAVNGEGVGYIGG